MLFLRTFYENKQTEPVAYEAGGGATATPVWKFQGKLCFQGKRKFLKNPER